MTFQRTVFKINFLKLLGLTTLCGAVTPSWAVPSFARQTGMACAACHTTFPELTPFGREFKLNGYVLDNIRQVTGIDTSARQTLAINSIPPISAMLQVSYTHTSKALPDGQLPGALAKDGEALFPDQVSLFYAGKIADELGAFMQLTYDGAADHFGFDNTDIRYAHHLSFGGADANDHHLIVGLTLNNNPTVQDVWNTTPAWGFPYSGSRVSPGLIAASQIDGRLGQSVAGLGVYIWLDEHFYVELSAYTAAIPGGAHPLDSTQSNVAHGLSPYWRLAYEQRWDRNSLSIGTYGLETKVHPGSGTALQGPTDRFKDIAADAQYQFVGEDHLATVLATYIHESQTLSASVIDQFAAHAGNNLRTFKLTGEYSYQRKIGGSLGYFSTTGSGDSILYSAASVVGSANGSPTSNGYIAEVNYLPWLNVKLQLQYVGYEKFNGAKTNYDGTGRNASDNNTFYGLVWLNY
ncbi:MAG: cytochrome C [Pseudomonadota bacterium]|nr:cytochrome C [Pseudomonadota bacterium]